MENKNQKIVLTILFTIILSINFTILTSFIISILSVLYFFTSHIESENYDHMSNSEIIKQKTSGSIKYDELSRGDQVNSRKCSVCEYKYTPIIVHHVEETYLAFILKEKQTRTEAYCYEHY